MSALTAKISYRPLRIGWCLKKGNLVDFRKALRWSHTLWGGKYNPIIAVDTDEAQDIVKNFHVDILYPVSDDPEIAEFIKKHPHLPWFDFKRGFENYKSSQDAFFLDIYHPVRHIYEQHVKNVHTPSVLAHLFEWDASDPLTDIFLIMYGAYPSKKDLGYDYSDFVLKSINRNPIHQRASVMTVNGDVTFDPFQLYTPSSLTAFDLRKDNILWQAPGIYVGSVNDFDDLVYFWNLRSSGKDLIFYDPSHNQRLKYLKDKFLEDMRRIMSAETTSMRSPWKDKIFVWHKPEGKPDLSSLGTGLLISDSGNIQSPLVKFEDHSVLGSLTDNQELPTLVIQLPTKPFFNDFSPRKQQAIITVSVWDFGRDNPYTFQTPYLPEINGLYGRESVLTWYEARVEKEGLGIISDIDRDQISLRAIPLRNMFSEIFKSSAMIVKPSKAGLIASQLIQQMGGLQSCRVFKISGVRKLINEYSPYRSFNRTQALSVIGPNFPAYEDLYIESREAGKLKPIDALDYLLKKEVFRPGLNFECPVCNLDFWVHLDNIASNVKCEFCGKNFNVSLQLKDRGWTFRRSGLFGREDHQEGGIPTVLVLQQLETMLTSRAFLYSTALTVNFVDQTKKDCEIDFAMLFQDFNQGLEMVIGECKSQGEITEEDVTNLKNVADTFNPYNFNVYILFAKLGPFTDAEIERCKQAQGKYQQRVIMLTDKQLEPYFISEGFAKEYENIGYGLSGLASVTSMMYFDKNRITSRGERLESK